MRIRVTQNSWCGLRRELGIISSEKNIYIFCKSDLHKYALSIVQILKKTQIFQYLTIHIHSMYTHGMGRNIKEPSISLNFGSQVIWSLSSSIITLKHDKRNWSFVGMRDYQSLRAGCSSGNKSEASIQTRLVRFQNWSHLLTKWKCKGRLHTEDHGSSKEK